MNKATRTVWPSRTERAARFLAWSLTLAYGLVAIATIALAQVLGYEAAGIGGTAEILIGGLLGLGSFAVVGGLLAAKLPRNPIGWLMLLAPLAAGTNGLAEQLSIYGLVTVPGSIVFAKFAGWLGLWLFQLLLMSLVFVLFLFPSGRLPSRRWRPVALLVGVFLLAVTFLYAFGSPGSALHPQIANPYLITALRPARDTVEAASWLYLVVFGLAGASLIARYRGGTRTEKQQLKWIVMAAGFMVGCFLIGYVVPGAIGWLLFLFALPIAIGIAILRHRLYDIDLIIKRTVVYGATSAAVAGTFFVGILALQTPLRALTSGSELAIAASTLLSFALFQPIRRRVQDLVNRRFDRSRYDAAHTVDAFADQLRDEVNLDALRVEFLVAVDRTMAPAHASLWLRMPTR